MVLSERDRDFLAALAAGETINDYARRNNFSLAWGSWKSREVRRKLGVATIREAVRMSEQEKEGVSRSDFDKLTGLVAKLGDAIEDLAKRPNEPAAQQQVRERELDVKDHAKALGLTLDDVERLKGEKEYERFKAMQERLERERDEELDDDDGGGDGNGAGKGGIGQVLDGLGGLSGVRKPK